MNLFISGEVHFHVGDSFRFCRNDIQKNVSSLLEKNNYGDRVSELFICPMIMPKIDEFIKNTGWKEISKYNQKTKEAEFRLIVDYEKFKSTDERGKRNLLLKNLIDSIHQLKEMVKEGFESDKLENDILRLFGMNSYEELLD